MNRWIISDTHFYHKNIINYCNRPLNCDDIMIDNLTRMVQREDILYHLGDVHFGREEELKSILSKIPSRVYLIRGNHDHWSDTKYLTCGFDGVFDSIGIGDVLLTHEPVFISGGYNLHGHLHNLGYNSKKTKGEEFDPFGGSYGNLNDGKHVLYSPELEDYKPILFNTIMGRIR